MVVLSGLDLADLRHIFGNHLGTDHEATGNIVDITKMSKKNSPNALRPVPGAMESRSANSSPVTRRRAAALASSSPAARRRLHSAMRWTTVI